MGLFGFTQGSGAGDIVPVVKFDARAGRMFRQDRADGMTTPVDITRTFRAIFDLQHVELGWMQFASGNAPDFVLVNLGEPFPARPSADHKQGSRVMVMLDKACGRNGDLDVREISNHSRNYNAGFEALVEAYRAAPESKEDKLPIVTLKETVMVTSGTGTQKSTNYQPIFEIVGWCARPAALVHISKAGAARAPTSVSPAPAPLTSAPPSTGSTVVAPPPAARAPVAADAGLGDFG